MPANYGLGLDEMECLAPPCPPLREPHPEEAIEETEPRSLRAAAEYGELLSERQILEREVGVGCERGAQGTHQSEYEGHCSPGSLLADPSSTLTIEFWQTTIGGNLRGASVRRCPASR